MNEVASIDRASTSERVAAAVRKLIWTGELAAGTRLNQDDLSARFGVSRIPIREALIALEHTGFISMTPHRGAFVEPLTAETIDDHYELYARVDGFAIEKVIERGHDLDAFVDALRAVADAADDRELFARVVSARRLLHALGGSPRFDAVARGLVGLVPGNFFEEVAGSGAIARRQLPLVAGALEANRADEAIAHYGSMLREQGRLVIGELAAKGVLLDPTER